MREERETVIREEPTVVREEPIIVREEPTTVVRSRRPAAVVADRDNFLGPILAVIGIVALLALVIWFFANGPAGSPDVSDNGGTRIENNEPETGRGGEIAPRGEADTGANTDSGAGAEAGTDAGAGAGADTGTDAGAGVDAGDGTETTP